MTPEEAAWVREHVWTPAFRAVEAAYPDGYLTRCSCEGGICGACDGTMDKGRARHDRCLSRSRGPIVSPLAYLTDGHFMVCGPALWAADGPACRYICPCPCAKTGDVPAPSRRRPATAEPTTTWYVDRLGNVYHRGDCPNREDAPRWREADGLDEAALSFIVGMLCPAPCARGERCAYHGFGATGSRRPIAPTRRVTAAPDGALFDLEAL